MRASVNTVIHADCLAFLPTLSENSVDAVVTDPPYGIKFMAKRWDYDVPTVDVWREVLRVLKPGGHLLCACGTRTQHRMVVNIEDAGFEIRDVVSWIYGSGFPKSLNIGKCHSEWEGWGTALKPACEFFTLARKPLSEKTVAANVLKWGTGGINIDGCRVAHVDVGDGTNLAMNPHKRKYINGGNGGHVISTEESRRVVIPNQGGRFPANVIHDGSQMVLDLFPDTGKSTGGRTIKRSGGGNVGSGKQSEKHWTNDDPGYGDSGTAARFFYCAKASKKERGEGNTHPTVKPIDLMQYLCRLITPSGGLVLDPYCGSGSTGVAAVREGFNFMGIEKEADYCELAKKRIDATTYASTS